MADRAAPAQDAADEHEGGKAGRGNYRCSRCGEPKKGHVCPYQPSNFKCTACGNVKKNCTCGVPLTRTIAVQCEMDEDMTTRVLDMRVQGVFDYPTTNPYDL